MTDMVTIADCRKGDYCVSGVKRQCSLLGLDFKRLVREGLPIDEIAEIDDVIVQRVLTIARERIEADGRRR